VLRLLAALLALALLADILLLAALAAADILVIIVEILAARLLLVLIQVAALGALALLALVVLVRIVLILSHHALLFWVPFLLRLASPADAPDLRSTISFCVTTMRWTVCLPRPAKARRLAIGS
jgi:hypothetical protein